MCVCYLILSKIISPGRTVDVAYTSHTCPVSDSHTVSYNLGPEHNTLVYSSNQLSLYNQISCFGFLFLILFWLWGRQLIFLPQSPLPMQAALPLVRPSLYGLIFASLWSQHEGIFLCQANNSLAHLGNVFTCDGSLRVCVYQAWLNGVSFVLYGVGKEWLLVCSLWMGVPLNEVDFVKCSNDDLYLTYTECFIVEAYLCKSFWMCFVS